MYDVFYELPNSSSLQDIENYLYQLINSVFGKVMVSIKCYCLRFPADLTPSKVIEYLLFSLNNVISFICFCASA